MQIAHSLCGHHGH
jgi:hypothetical protein